LFHHLSCMSLLQFIWIKASLWHLISVWYVPPLYWLARCQISTTGTESMWGIAMGRRFLGTLKVGRRWFFWILLQYRCFGCLKWWCSIGHDVGWKHTSLPRIAHIWSGYWRTHGKRTCQCYTGHT
jgi:hypothetical protein